MKKFIVTFLATIGALFVVSMAALYGIGYLAMDFCGRNGGC